jgi:hypothetical protein
MKQSEHKDIAHPITAECRDYIQKKVLEAYEKERKSPSPSPSPVAKSAAGGHKAPIAVEDEDIEL